MAANEYGFDPKKTYLEPDNEFWDGTDAAHPAWWRGNDQGVALTSLALKRIVESGSHLGVFGGKEIEECAQAILKLYRKAHPVRSRLARWRAAWKRLL